MRLWRAGHRVVLWNCDPRDYAQRSSEDVRAWFRNNPLQSGDLVLMHDRLPFAAEVLPEVVSASRQRGLAFATLDEWVR
jgi:peptidoglycan/xylan/chitin deacetylase (PgdA/CDA1 family)